MELQREGNVLLVTLGASCTIVDVEDHTQRLRTALASSEQEGQGKNAVRRLDIDAGKVEEVDTAYIQLLLVVREELTRQGGTFSLHRVTPCLNEALACYGIHL